MMGAALAQWMSPAALIALRLYWFLAGVSFGALVAVAVGALSFSIGGIA